MVPLYVATTAQEKLQRTDLQPQNEAKVILFMIFFSLVALVTVTFRVVSKWLQWARLFWDDLLLLLALLQMLSINVLFVVAIKYGGLGRHTSEVSKDQLRFFMKSYFISGLVIPTCYATAKLSILCLLHEVFTFRRFQKLVRILVAVVACWWMATILLDTFICYPVNARWDTQIGGTCNNKVVQVEYFATPIPWIITDFAILIAPLPVLWQMKIPRARQIGLIVLFGFGVTTCAVACKRYITLLGIDDQDLTSSMVEPCIWTMIESSTTVTCAALPASTHALKRILPTARLTRAVEFIEDRFHSWRDKSTVGECSVRRDGEVLRDSLEPPAAHSSTRRLDVTPV